MADIEKVKRNIQRMIDQGAPETDIDTYLSSEGVTVSDLKSQPEKTSALGALWQGLKQGSTFGFGDELQAGVAAGTVGLMNKLGMDTGGLTAKDAYGQALSDFRGDLQKSREDRKYLTGLGELGGAVITGGAGLQRAPAALGAMARQAPVRTGAALGALSGGVYGFGSGEGGLQERLKDAASGTALGGITGGAAVPVARAVGAGLGSIGTKLKEPFVDITERVTKQPFVKPEEKAIDKVVSKLKKDFPDEADFKAALDEWINTEDLGLAEIAGKQTQRLARGSAQYPSGEQFAGEYIYEKRIPTIRDSIKSTFSETISPSRNIYDTIDSVVEKGRAKASPLYDKAYASNTAITDQSINTILERPAVKKALKDGIQIMRNEGRYLGAPDPELKAIVRDLSAVGKMDDVNGAIAGGFSLRTLDHTKRALDEMIGREIRSGGTASDLIAAKNDLVSILDKADKSGAYKKAREVSGDYLTHKSAIESGRKFMKTDKLLLERQLKDMTEAQRESFKDGVVQQLRDVVDNSNDRSNLYNQVLGKNQTMRDKLKTILSDAEYKEMENGLRGAERLYNFKNSLGNSITAAKQIDAGEFTPDELSLLDVASDRLAFSPTAAALSLSRHAIKKVSQSMSDDMAGEVSKILFETDPNKKLELLKKIQSSKSLQPQQKTEMLQTYYAMDDFIKNVNSAKVGFTAGAGTGAMMPKNEQ